MDMKEAVSRHAVYVHDVRHGAHRVRRRRVANLRALLDERHTEPGIPVQAVLQHLLVALLEYLKGYRRVGKHHDVQREEGKADKLVGHRIGGSCPVCAEYIVRVGALPVASGGWDVWSVGVRARSTRGFDDLKPLMRLRVKKRFAGFALDCEAEFSHGVTAIFGPSGSGKTTLLNCIAGLVTPDEGEIEAMGRVVFSSSSRRNEPPERRRFGYVFQDSALFPHLSVRENIMYGYRLTPKRLRRTDPSRLVELFGLGALMERRVAGLSGGERPARGAGPGAGRVAGAAAAGRAARLAGRRLPRCDNRAPQERQA